MSDQLTDINNDGYDDLGDNPGVASHAHPAGHLRRGSAFSRGEQGWAYYDPTDNGATSQDDAARMPNEQAVYQPPQRKVQPTPRQTPVSSTPPTQLRNSSPRQAPRPATQAQAPLRRRASSAVNVASAEANRAAFDARYGTEPAVSGNNSQKLGRFRLWLRSRRQRRYDRPYRRHPFLKFLGVLVLAVVLSYLLVCVPIDHRIAFDEPEASQVAAVQAEHMPIEPYYVLLLGSDAREGEEVSRTDTMILARIDIVANQITLLSIPRDTMVTIDGYGTQKINAAYAYGGAAGAMQAVEKLLGVPIAEAAVVHFDGIASLVDALGGITVEVPVDVNDPDYTGLVMPAGTYDMDGQTALLFSRVRHGFALGDYQRQADQVLVIQAIMNKARHLMPWQLAQAGLQVGPMFDTSMRCYDVIPLLTRMMVGHATLYRASIPSYTEMIDGVSYVIADENATATLMAVIDAGGNPEDAGVTLGLEG